MRSCHACVAASVPGCSSVAGRGGNGTPSHHKGKPIPPRRGKKNIPPAPFRPPRLLMERVVRRLEGFWNRKFAAGHVWFNSSDVVSLKKPCASQSLAKCCETNRPQRPLLRTTLELIGRWAAARPSSCGHGFCKENRQPWFPKSHPFRKKPIRDKHR